MQDFTKLQTDNNNFMLQATKEKWLTKDRFWTFVFWFGMSGGLAVGDVFRFNLKILQVASFIDWTTLALMPLLVLIFNRTRFIKKDTFANSEGKILTKKQLPYMFPLAIMLGFGLAFIVAETILPKGVENIIISFIFFSFLFSGLSLYFIFKNCPISILFNYKFWVWKSHQNASCPNIRVSSSNDRFRNYTSSSSRSSSALDLYTNPVYGGFSGNIHNKYRR